MTQKSEAYINPRILKWAREQCGYTHEEAVQSNFNPEKLKRAEKGEEPLSFKQLLFIANRFKRSPAFFYLKKHPDDEKLIHDFRKTDPKKIKFSPFLRNQIIDIKEKREISVEFKQYGVEYDYRYVNSINIDQNPEDVAIEIINLLNLDIEARTEWKDEYEAFNSWRNAFENIGIMIFQVSRIDVEEMRGFSFSEIPYPSIALNRSDSPLGRIFTLIHELSHIMLNKGGICTLRTEDEMDFEIEKFCNAIAGAVLVPANVLIEIETVKYHEQSEEWVAEELFDLKRIFWCSSEVILRRLLIIDKTTHEFYQKMREYWRNLPKTSKGGPEKTYERVLRTNPKIYIKILLSAMYDHKLTMTEVSSYLNMSLKHLKNLESKLE
ncbi:MAG: ImmA/IrrE family metallo-endopeptidase [Candidatus Lokiarchaeia archaeon]